MNMLKNSLGPWIRASILLLLLGNALGLGRALFSGTDDNQARAVKLDRDYVGRQVAAPSDRGVSMPDLIEIPSDCDGTKPRAVT
jgi:hypothetical protein